MDRRGPARYDGRTMAKWERRWHPLREEWVVVAAHRQHRPWHGQEEDGVAAEPPAYDPACHLCPGNRRIGGARNPRYDGVWVFDNDHPCVGPDAPTDLAPAPGVYRNAPARGVARVVCYTPEHHRRLAQLELDRVDDLLRCWQEQHRELAARDEVASVLIFENNGREVGVSNPHPHCQIYATDFVLPAIAAELAATRRHRAATGRALFGDLLRTELEDGRRILDELDGAVAFVPYCARWAYEVWVAPRAAHASLADLEDAERRDLAEALRRTLARYDNLWRRPFPYVLAVHSAPTDGADHAPFHCHIALHPPLRAPNLLKFLAGPEIGAGAFIADTWPEDSAARLRALDTVHHAERRPVEGPA